MDVNALRRWVVIPSIGGKRRRRRVSFYPATYVWNQLCPQPLFVKYPALFKEERFKDCLVKDRVSVDDSGLRFSWAWARSDIDVNSNTELSQLTDSLSGLCLGLGKDRWIWKYATDGVFNVAGIKKVLSSANRESPERVFKWNNWIPEKVAIVAWRADMERLPTKCALSRRNIPVQNNMCALCGDYAETSEHIFVACQFAQTVWQNLAAWCNVPPIIAFDLNDLLTLHEVTSGTSKRRKVLHAVILVAIWSLWKLRNEVVFRNMIPNTTKTLDEIKAMAYLWIKSRSKMMSMTWDDWCRFEIFD
ncbi:uncharacterized protein LOC110881061 [Helianthus annuus]|uniref:uncharacterized protein LOC110881061 n=1 Tax=Helianthus annuus TaxID=4232 RepID=UPI000B8F5953|nr:uncharacterized protein LOC110881061 [Helianthus annuus]